MFAKQWICNKLILIYLHVFDEKHMICKNLFPLIKGFISHVKTCRSLSNTLLRQLPSSLWSLSISDTGSTQNRFFHIQTQIHNYDAEPVLFLGCCSSRSRWRGGFLLVLRKKASAQENNQRMSSDRSADNTSLFLIPWHTHTLSQWISLSSHEMWTANNESQAWSCF